MNVVTAPGRAAPPFVAPVIGSIDPDRSSASARNTFVRVDWALSPTVSVFHEFPPIAGNTPMKKVLMTTDAWTLRTVLLLEVTKLMATVGGATSRPQVP